MGKDIAGRAFDAATIGRGACVVTVPMPPSPFLGAKITHALLPQGQAERVRRVIRMVDQMDSEAWRLHQHR